MTVLSVVKKSYIPLLNERTSKAHDRNINIRNRTQMINTKEMISQNSHTSMDRRYDASILIYIHQYTTH